MHGQRFTERTGFAHQDPAAVAKRTIQGFHDAGLPAAFGAGLVRVGGQDRGIGFSGIGVVRCMDLIMRRQRLKKPPSRGRAPAAQYPGHYAPGGPFNRQLQPHFPLALANKGPHLIHF